MEAAARALVARVHATAWDHLSEETRDVNRGDARAARTAVPQLLDQIDQAEARIEAVEDVLDQWQVDGYDALRRRIRRALEG